MSSPYLIRSCGVRKDKVSSFQRGSRFWWSSWPVCSQTPTVDSSSTLLWVRYALSLFCTQILFLMKRTLFGFDKGKARSLVNEGIDITHHNHVYLTTLKGSTHKKFIFNPWGVERWELPVRVLIEIDYLVLMISFCVNRFRSLAMDKNGFATMCHSGSDPSGAFDPHRSRIETDHPDGLIGISIGSFTSSERPLVAVWATGRCRPNGRSPPGTRISWIGLRCPLHSARFMSPRVIIKNVIRYILHICMIYKPFKVRTPLPASFIPLPGFLRAPLHHSGRGTTPTCHPPSNGEQR